MPARQKSEFYECQHVRPSGKKCAPIAIRGHHFCYFQSPRETVPTRAGCAPKRL